MTNELDIVIVRIFLDHVFFRVHFTTLSILRIIQELYVIRIALNLENQRKIQTSIFCDVRDLPVSGSIN